MPLFVPVYLLIIGIGMCISYVVIAEVYWLFFVGSLAPLRRRSLLSIVLIFLFCAAAFTVSLMIPDKEFGNRVLHALGGGFVAFFVCFRAVRDTRLPITRFQFFILGALTVTAMGVGNELLELLLQTTLGFFFSQNPYDTWLDLLSNTVGILVAAAVMVPFVPKKKQ